MLYPFCSNPNVAVNVIPFSWLLLALSQIACSTPVPCSLCAVILSINMTTKINFQFFLTNTENNAQFNWCEYVIQALLDLLTSTANTSKYRLQEPIGICFSGYEWCAYIFWRNVSSLTFLIYKCRISISATLILEYSNRHICKDQKSSTKTR